MEDIKIKDIVDELWAKAIHIIIFSIIATILAYALTSYLDRIYKADAAIFPSEILNSSSGISINSGIGALLGGQQMASSKYVFKLTSRDMISEFIGSKIFQNALDRSEVKEIPGTLITANGANPIRLSLFWHNPKDAEYLLLEYYKFVNDTIAKEERIFGEGFITAIESQLSKTSNSFLQSSLANLYEREYEKMVRMKLSTEPFFTLAEKPSSSVSPYYPNIQLLTVISFLLAFALSTFYFLFKRFL